MVIVPGITAAERLMQASKKSEFNLRNYAKKRNYSISSARLEGTVLGEKSPSLKVMIDDLWQKAIFAVVKNGKVLGAKSIKGDFSQIIINTHYILEQLYKKGKINKDELKLVKKYLPF